VLAYSRLRKRRTRRIRKFAPGKSAARSSKNSRNKRPSVLFVESLQRKCAGRGEPWGLDGGEHYARSAALYRHRLDCRAPSILAECSGEKWFPEIRSHEKITVCRSRDQSADREALEIVVRHFAPTIFLSRRAKSGSSSPPCGRVGSRFEQIGDQFFNFEVAHGSFASKRDGNRFRDHVLASAWLSCRCSRSEPSITCA